MKTIWIALLFFLVSCASQSDQRHPASEKKINERIPAESYLNNR